MSERLWRLYDALLRWRWFHRCVEAVFLLEGALGLLLALAVGMGTLMGQFEGGKHNHIEIAGLFWHFVDLVWIIVFTFVYLVPSTNT